VKYLGLQKGPRQSLSQVREASALVRAVTKVIKSMLAGSLWDPVFCVTGFEDPLKRFLLS